MNDRVYNVIQINKTMDGWNYMIDSDISVSLNRDMYSEMKKFEEDFKNDFVNGNLTQSSEWTFNREISNGMIYVVSVVKPLEINRLPL